MKIKIIASMVFILAMVSPLPVYAHKVVVFAWVEDGMIYTQSSFGGKRKAKSCPIIVMDEKDMVVHKGVTDEQGEYVFRIPENVNSDLLVNLKAGTGHKAHWRIPYDELAAPMASSDVAAVKAKKEDLEKGPSFFKIISGLAIIFLVAFVLKTIKRKSLKRKGTAND